MHLKQIQYVVETAKCKSFSKASKKLFISQPSLSLSVSTLEEELGVKIFYRTPHGIIVTEEGKKVLEYAETVLYNLNQLRHVSESSIMSYTATLASIPVANNGLTISLLKSLAINHPEIKINILEVRPQKILSNITNGHADFAIGSYTSSTEKQILEDAKKNNISLEPLLVDEFCMLLPCHHRKANQPYITLKEMADSKQAIFNDFLIIEEDNAILENGTNLTNYYMFSDLSGIKQAVAAELAYAVLPHQIVLDDLHIRSGLIKALPIADSAAQVTTYLAWRNHNYTSKEEIIVLDQIRSLYKDVALRLQQLQKNTLFVEDQEHFITRY